MFKSRVNAVFLLSWKNKRISKGMTTTEFEYCLMATSFLISLISETVDFDLTLNSATSTSKATAIAFFYFNKHLPSLSAL